MSCWLSISKFAQRINCPPNLYSIHIYISKFCIKLKLIINRKLSAYFKFEIIFQVCCCARLTTKSARGKASCPAAFWAPAGPADSAQSFPPLRCGPQSGVMVYTHGPATTSDMESHAQVAAPSMEKAKTNDPVTVLHPFAHQVGGHTQLMLLDHSTLCKPLIQRELLFYLNVPRGMRNFVPQYKGTAFILITFKILIFSLGGEYRHVCSGSENKRGRIQV